VVGSLERNRSGGDDFRGLLDHGHDRSVERPLPGAVTGM
jgi:hypothetical protein